MNEAIHPTILFLQLLLILTPVASMPLKSYTRTFRKEKSR